LHCHGSIGTHHEHIENAFVYGYVIEAQKEGKYGSPENRELDNVKQGSFCVKTSTRVVKYSKGINDKNIDKVDDGCVGDGAFSKDGNIEWNAKVSCVAYDSSNGGNGVLFFVLKQKLRTKRSDNNNKHNNHQIETWSIEECDVDGVEQ